MDLDGKVGRSRKTPASETGAKELAGREDAPSRTLRWEKGAVLRGETEGASAWQTGGAGGAPLLIVRPPGGQHRPDPAAGCGARPTCTACS